MSRFFRITRSIRETMGPEARKTTLDSIFRSEDRVSALTVAADAALVVVIVVLFVAMMRFVPRTAPVNDGLPQSTPQLQQEKDLVLARVRAALTDPLSDAEKNSLFTTLLDDNSRLTFTPSEKEEIYRVLHGR